MYNVNVTEYICSILNAGLVLAVVFCNIYFYLKAE